MTRLILNNPNKATLIGLLSVILWSFSSLLTLKINTLPIFQTLAIIFTFSFSVILLFRTAQPKRELPKVPIASTLICALALFGNEYFYVAAFKFAPPAHVDILFALWPLMVIVILFFLNEKLRYRYLLGCAFGLVALILIVHDKSGAIISTFGHWKGYILAFIGAICAAIYTVYTRNRNTSVVDDIFIYSGVCALLAFVLHICYETTILPTYMEIITICTMGIITNCIAYLLWNYGLQFGNDRLLCVVSYTTPVISSLILVIFGAAHLTPHLLGAITMICIAGLTCIA